MARLGDLYQITSGGTPSRKHIEYYQEGTIPWVKTGDLKEKYLYTTDENITDIGLKNSSARIYPKDTVLIAMYGATIGASSILKIEAATNQACAAFVRRDDVIPEYLYAFLQSQHSRFIKDAVGGAQPNLSAGYLKKIDMPIIPINKQRYIADLFNKVSDLIAKRRQQLDKLDLLVKSKFVEMFGDCKMNPKKWNICNLEEIAEVGSSKRVFVEELKETGIPFYRGTEVGALAEGKSITAELFITKEHYQELCQATGIPQKGDLLMPSICPDGRIWVVNSDEPFYFKDGRVLWVHNINKRFNPIFLLYTLKDRIMTDYNSIASGTTFAELKIFALKKCQIFDVSIELQDQFANFVEQTQKTKKIISQSLEKLETLKKALMQEYFG